MRMQLLLPVLQSHRQIRRTTRLPKEIEIVSHPLALVEPRHRAEKPVRSFEPDRSVLDGGRFTRRRCARKFSSLGCALNSLVATAFLLTRHGFGQKIQFRLSKLEIVTQHRWQRNDTIKQTRLFLCSRENVRQRNQKQ